jgi:hypothetical protein
MGVAVPYSHQYCWSLFFDTISNGCGDVETLDIPILYEWSGPGGGGWTAMYVNAFGASANNNVGCQAVSVDGVHATNNLTYWASGYYYLPQFGHTQTLMLGNGVWVPAQGYEFVTCQVSPGGQINNIYYEPGW